MEITINQFIFTIMKKTLKAIAMLALATMAFACGKPEVEEKIDPGKGLLNFTIMIPEDPVEYTATKAGPYAPEETVIVEIPSLYENPTDVTALEAYASFDNNCYADPAVPAIIDFTTPYTLTTVLANGEKQVNYIEVKLVYPSAKVEQLWRTDATAMGLVWYNWANIAVDKDYVYVLDAVQNVGDQIIKLDRKTGEAKGTIALPTSCLANIHVDDAGHLVVTRYNIYGAGFRLFVYDPTANTWAGPIIDYIPIEGVLDLPADFGQIATLVGDVTKTAYVYTSAPGDDKIYSWKFEGGVPQAEPTITKYSGTTAPWFHARFRKASASDDANLYASMNFYTGGEDSKAVFQQMTPSFDLTSIDMANFGQRILNFKTFVANGSEWLAMAYQDTYERWSGSHFALFNIQNRDNWTMVPGANRYNFDFRLYNGETYGGVNYEQTNGLDVFTDSDAVYVYVSSPAKGSGDAVSDAANTHVTCYKITFTK